jgi:hypothetical protein
MGGAGSTNTITKKCIKHLGVEENLKEKYRLDHLDSRYEDNVRTEQDGSV